MGEVKNTTAPVIPVESKETRDDTDIIPSGGTVSPGVDVPPGTRIIGIEVPLLDSCAFTPQAVVHPEGTFRAVEKNDLSGALTKSGTTGNFFFTLLDAAGAHKIRMFVDTAQSGGARTFRYLFR